MDRQEQSFTGHWSRASFTRCETEGTLSVTETFATKIESTARWSEPVSPSLSCDRWLLISNLHKAVRRGLADAAADTAVALVRSAPDYLFRRLPALACEEVSAGNLEACLESIIASRSPSIRGAVGDEKVAAYLARRLAESPKSRAACDLLCLVHAQLGTEGTQALVRETDLTQAVMVAGSPHHSMIDRAIALLALDMRTGRRPVARLSLRDTIRDRLGQSELLANVVAEGYDTDGLAALVLLVQSLTSQDERAGYPPIVCDNDPPSGFVEEPILLAALDKHTRIGRRAIQTLAIESREIRGYFVERGMLRRAVDQIGKCLFYLEGALRDRIVTTPSLDDLHRQTVAAELRSVGVADEDAPLLIELMQASLPMLDEIRRRLWAA